MKKVKIKIISDPDAIKSLSDGLRTRILDALRQLQPASATALAAELGESAPKISYHLKQLEQYDIVYLAETRTKGNLIENLYAPTAEQYVIQRDLSAPEGLKANVAAVNAVRELSALIFADLLRLPYLEQPRPFKSTISYGSYYLSLGELEELREMVIAKLDSFGERRPEPGLLACNLGFLLIDKETGDESHE